MTGAIFCETRPAMIIKSAWRGEGRKHFGAKAGDIVTVGGHRHHLDGAAGQSKRQRPERALAGPVHGVIELS